MRDTLHNTHHLRIGEYRPRGTLDVAEKRTDAARVDPELIIGLKNGDHRCFERIFHLFFSKIKAFSLALTKSADQAEEITQTVFVNLWTNKDNINPEKNFNAYLYTIARNTAVNSIKARNNRHRREEAFWSELSSGPSDENLIAAEIDLLIKLTVSHMPPKRKQVYELSKYEYKTNEEIALLLDINKKVVEKHLRLALNEIRNIIKVFLLILLP